MSRIYSGDTKAIMWLELQSSDSNIAMDYLQRVYQQCVWIAYQLLAENGLPNVGSIRIWILSFSVRSSLRVDI
jgi:hypothetical protein